MVLIDAQQYINRLRGKLGRCDPLRCGAGCAGIFRGANLAIVQRWPRPSRYEQHSNCQKMICKEFKATSTAGFKSPQEPGKNCPDSVATAVYIYIYESNTDDILPSYLPTVSSQCIRTTITPATCTVKIFTSFLFYIKGLFILTCIYMPV